MTVIKDLPSPWRKRLVPAKYAGVIFHVEQQARSSGRRVVTHEYPKRNEPYSEDMGRAAIRYQITGYLVAPDYYIAKQQLISALENSEGGVLVDPYNLGREITCICERYSVTEVRERGGFCSFDMLFVEIGTAGNIARDSSPERVAQAGNNLDNQAGLSFNEAFGLTGEFGVSIGQPQIGQGIQ